MKRIALIESLNFGLSRLNRCAIQRNIELVLLSKDLGRYDYELRENNCPGLKIIEVNTSDVDQVKRELRRLRGLVGIINMTDTWSLISSSVCEEFSFPSEDERVIELLRNKHKVRNLLYEKGLSRSKSYILEDDSDIKKIIEMIGFPLILKDTAGTGKLNAWAIRNSRQLDSVLEDLKNRTLRGKLLVESLFHGTLYSLESITWNGNTKILGVTSRILSPEPDLLEEASAFPTVFPVKIQERLQTWIDRVLQTLNLRKGITHTEFLVTKEGFEIVEVNPRIGGVLVGEAICQSTQINIYESILEMALGEEPNIFRSNIKYHNGVAQYIFFSPGPGRFEQFSGTENLDDFPGAPKLYPICKRGYNVPYSRDSRDTLGCLLAAGETSEIALLNVMSASRIIKPIIRSKRGGH